MSARSLTSPLIAASASILAILAGCASAPDSGDAEGFPVDPYAVVASDSGGFSIEARTSPRQPPQRGLVDVELRVRDAAGEPADNLTITVEPWMPDMGHGASTRPIMNSMGDGRYVASQVSLFMPGRWELRTTIEGAPKDRAVISFQIP